jgi:tRNA nucleotidyltransferase (CCA-adding enzyme)
MADVSVPGSELTAGDAAGERFDPEAIRRLVPEPVLELLRTLWSAGHSAYVVGGSLRDALLGRTAEDWDLATSALPEQTVELFPGAVYENRFGTVAVRRDAETYEITTFRSDHDYADFRRPHRVEFGTSLEADLARRDFTVNAMAWGAPGVDGGVGAEADQATSRDARSEPVLVDPFDGRADVATRTLRAVGEPVRRFEEDALRMVRAVRLAATLDFSIEPATLGGIHARAPLVAHLSGERIAAELGRLLAAPRPSVGMRLLAETRLLSHISPDLAAQPGVPQNKIPGEDLWDHTLRTVDAAIDHPVVRLAALVHDIGKPATADAGHFYGHETLGAELTRAFLDRLHEPRAVTERVALLVRNHMFGYEPTWSEAAVRRFIGKVGPDAVGELFALREADNVGSGLERSAGGLAELRARVATEMDAGPILDRSALAIDGDDLMAELGLTAGPGLGRVLETLLERVIEDRSLNEAPTLLLLARQLVADDR